MNVQIAPHSLCGKISAIGSKSFAHRALIASALFGTQKVSLCGVTPSQDIAATVSCLESLGAKVENFVVTPVREAAKKAVFNCGESGSTLRFFLPIAAALGVDATFVGSPRLMQRPLEPLLQVLQQAGVSVDGMHVCGKLHSGDFHLRADVSSQYVTGMLFALSLLHGTSRLFLEGPCVSQEYVDISLQVLADFGAKISKTDFGFIVEGRAQTSRTTYCVEGDWSNAAFFLVAGAIGGDITMENLRASSCQGDRRIVDILKIAGADVSVGDTITVKKSRLHAFKVDAQQIPDMVPALSVLAAASQGTTEISGVERLRLKESDRLQGVLDMLHAAGVCAKYENSVLYVTGGKATGATFDAQNDHRMAMSQTVLALCAQGNSTVVGAQCVEKSYPSFFKDVNKLGGCCVSVEGQKN